MGGDFVSECREPESTCELGHLKYMKSMVFLFRLSKNRYGYYSSSFQTYKSRSVFQEVKTQGIEIGTFLRQNTHSPLFHDAIEIKS